MYHIVNMKESEKCKAIFCYPQLKTRSSTEEIHAIWPLTVAKEWNGNQSIGGRRYRERLSVWVGG